MSVSPSQVARISQGQGPALAPATRTRPAVTDHPLPTARDSTTILGAGSAGWALETGTATANVVQNQPREAILRHLGHGSGHEVSKESLSFIRSIVTDIEGSLVSPRKARRVSH